MQKCTKVYTTDAFIVDDFTIVGKTANETVPPYPKSPQAQPQAQPEIMRNDNTHGEFCQFWDNYKISKCPADGHCFIHAVVMSYNSQENHSHTIDNENLLEQIKAESISNFDQYVGNYENKSVDGFVIDMNNYIYHKVYNSLFGDMVPMITSAVLRIEIIIVEMAAGRMNETKVSYNNYGMEPISHAYPVYVYKTGEHYDAIIPKSIAIDASSSEKVTLASKKETSADHMDAMVNFRNQNPQNLITGQFNINGLRNNFFEVHDILIQNLMDLLFLSETKLDGSFPNAQFRVPGFKHYRADRKWNGGGIAAYIRNDLPHRRRPDLESLVIPPVELIAIEVLIRKEVWLYFCLYCPHSKYKNMCCDTIDYLNDASRASRATNAFFIGDLNINLMC